MSGNERPYEEYLEEFGQRYASAARTSEHEANATPRATRASRLRRRVPIAIGVAAAGAVLVAVTLPSGGQLDIVQAASAALGSQEDLVHYRLHTEITLPGSHLDSGCSNQPFVEVWQTAAPLRYRMHVPAPPKACDGNMMTPDGEQITGAQEWASDGTIQTTYTADLNRLERTTGAAATSMPIALPGLQSGATDPVSALRTALNSGQLHAGTRSAGRMTLTGRTTETTDGGKRPSGLIIHHDLRYVVDALTYRPIQLSSTDTTFFFKGNGRPKDGKSVSRITMAFDRYEVVPLNKDSERLLSIHPIRPAVTVTSPAK